MLVTDPKQVSSAFQSFYAKLCKSEVVCNTFLSKLQLPCLSEEKAKKMANMAMSLEELKEPVREMQIGNSPGTDWILPEFIFEYS